MKERDANIRLRLLACAFRDAGRRLRLRASAVNDVPVYVRSSLRDRWEAFITNPVNNAISAIFMSIFSILFAWFSIDRNTFICIIIICINVVYIGINLAIITEYENR